MIILFSSSIILSHSCSIIQNHHRHHHDYWHDHHLVERRLGIWPRQSWSREVLPPLRPSDDHSHDYQNHYCHLSVQVMIIVMIFKIVIVATSPSKLKFSWYLVLFQFFKSSAAASHYLIYFPGPLNVFWMEEKPLTMHFIGLFSSSIIISRSKS